MTTQFEATTLPVTDVDRAKDFYQRLGWRLDIDFNPTPDTRTVQVTPPGSQASIQFGEGAITMTEPLQRLLLVVDDIEAAREDLLGRGIDVSDVFHRVPDGLAPGLDPDRSSYNSFVAFADPDGNQWLVQEITQRLPGRVQPTDVGARSQLLLETAMRHDRFEKAAPPHDWWDWYGAYMDAREQGSTPDEASDAADRYMADVKHVVVSVA